MKRLDSVDRSERIYQNSTGDRLQSEPPSRRPQRFHESLPGYAATPLHDLPGLAAELGLSKLWVKDESNRFGLPAFKIMGASWAVVQAASSELQARTGQSPPESSTLVQLGAIFEPLHPLTLTCATDGNHGRAVARMARLLGFHARIFVPNDMSPVRTEAIRGENAEVVIFDGTYDEAVAHSATLAGPSTLVISDTSWPGYEEVPRWVIEGYSTILWEIDDELHRRRELRPDLVAVQIGVGALAAAVVGHFRRADADPHVFVVGVEPTRAACAIASIEAGEIVELPGPHDSIMSGLNCGVPSPLAWPLLSSGIDVFIAIEDERARAAMRGLAQAGVVAGECGAAGLAGLATWASEFGGDLRGKRALVISTEGATDPATYAEIMRSGQAGPRGRGCGESGVLHSTPRAERGVSGV